MSHTVLLTKSGKALLIKSGIALSVRYVSPDFITAEDDTLTQTPTPSDTLGQSIVSGESLVIPEAVSEQLICNW